MVILFSYARSVHYYDTKDGTYTDLWLSKIVYSRIYMMIYSLDLSLEIYWLISHQSHIDRLLISVASVNWFPLHKLSITNIHTLWHYSNLPVKVFNVWWSHRRLSPFRAYYRLSLDTVRYSVLYRTRCSDVTFTDHNCDQITQACLVSHEGAASSDELTR